MNHQKPWPLGTIEWELRPRWPRVWRSWPFQLLVAILTAEVCLFCLVFDPSVFMSTDMSMERNFPFLYSPGDTLNERYSVTILAFFLVCVVLNMLVVLPLRRRSFKATLISELQAVPDARRLRTEILFGPRLFAESILAFGLPVVAAWCLDERFGELPAAALSSWYPLLLLVCFLLADRAVVLRTLSPVAGVGLKLGSLAMIPFGFVGVFPCLVSLLGIPLGLYFLSRRVWIGLRG